MNNKPPISPSHAMVLAAGLGTRMRPITDKTPKPLVKVNNRTLIDHALDRLVDGGIRQAVVNLHHFGDQIERNLGRRDDIELTFSWEKEERLETGGGVKQALDNLGDDPFWVINSDSIWLNGPINMMTRMCEVWDDDKMDALLLLHSTVDAYGYDGVGDFNAESDGKLTRRMENEVTPWLFTGIQILHPRLFENAPDGAFSLNLLYDKALENERLFGMVHDGEWFHVGTPEGLGDAEEYMKYRYAGVKHR
jgi:N-acetyl-alpha-D-muramate 1-phosphate uridylyltransferase